MEDEEPPRTDDASAAAAAAEEGGQSSPAAIGGNNVATTTGHSSSLTKVKTEEPAALAEPTAAARNGSCKAALAMSDQLVKEELVDSVNPVDSGVSDMEDSTSSATPLNLTVKKRRTSSDAMSKATSAPSPPPQQQSRSAFESVSRAAPTLNSALSMALSSGPSPYVLNRMLPYSLFSTMPNGSVAGTTANGTVAASVAAASPDALLGGQESSLLFGSYFNMQPASGKQQRPFKAYNPMDPMSALQINGLGLQLRNGPAAAPDGAMNGSPKSAAQYLTDQLLQPYRQYLQNQPGLLSPVSRSMGTTATGIGGSIGRVKGDAAEEAKCSSKRGGKTNGASQNTPSPPEVTSTSHPHTDHHHHHHHLHVQHALTGRCLSSASPSGSETGASSAGMNSSSSPVTSEELLERVGQNGNQSVNKNGAADDQLCQQAMMSVNRRKGRILPDTLKDDAYWERRRKNNEAAKRSRDARRAKEDEIAVRAALLEQENMRLRIEVAALKAETEKLRQLLLKG